MPIQREPSAAVPPTEAEWEAARRILAASLRRASLAQIGGFRPPDIAVSSWWGGNFVSEPGETVPVREKSGRIMHPVLQIRLDELPYRPPQLEGIALISIWFDLETHHWWQASNGTAFCLRTYIGLGGLAPLGPLYRARNAKLPILPVRWRLAEADGPDWEDIGLSFPRSVARWPDRSWFFENNCPNFGTKVGGWPAWCQASQGAEDFVLQIASEPKGKLMWGDNGCVYLFLKDGRWRIAGDCY
jgi:hypothetical protein